MSSAALAVTLTQTIPLWIGVKKGLSIEKVLEGLPKDSEIEAPAKAFCIRPYVKGLFCKSSLRILSRVRLQMMYWRSLSLLSVF